MIALVMNINIVFCGQTANQVIALDSDVQTRSFNHSQLKPSLLNNGH